MTLTTEKDKPKRSGNEEKREKKEDRKRSREEELRNRKKPFHENGERLPRNRRPFENGFKNKSSKARDSNRGHASHFGQVMRSVPCRNHSRTSTLSIAIPGSIVSNCQTKELRTQLVGQIARAATIYHVDEIVVFDDKLSRASSGMNQFSRKHRDNKDDTDKFGANASNGSEPQEQGNKYAPSDPHSFFARVLQYCETPQYLRKHLFPMHPDLQFAGLLPPVDAPHHVRADDSCKYREGIVLEKTGKNGGSLVNCGVYNRPVAIATRLQPGIRCTVKIDPLEYKKNGPISGEPVSPSAPREENGTYWGYTTRRAESIKSVFEECPFEGGYDLKIGTSERGNSDVDSPEFSLPWDFQHAIILFGGVAGIEECVDAEESFKLPGSKSHQLFDFWINVCKYQGSRTIRTEEAVLITLAKLSPRLVPLANGVPSQETIGGNRTATASNGRKPTTKLCSENQKEVSSDVHIPTVLLKDENISEESSEEEA